MDIPSTKPTAIQAVAEYDVGQVVLHKVLRFRGVIVDADAHFHGPQELLQRVPESTPAPDCPWYRVLVHNSVRQAYVAERDLEPDPTGQPVEHPLLRTVFRAFRNGRYLSLRTLN